MDFTQATPGSMAQFSGWNAQTQIPTTSPSGIQAPGPTPAPSNPVYHALEDFEREARQKKFMIAECEDEIANLKKEREEVSQQNKDLGAECEKLEMEAMAAEMKYEKMQKDKTLLLSQYEAVSNEMNELSQILARKRAQKQKFQLAHEERMKLIAKKGEEFMASLRRIPSIASVLEKRETNKKLKVEVEQSEGSLKELEKKFSELDARYPDEWETFVKKCIKMAETNQELKTKLQNRDNLKIAIKEREERVLVRKVGVGKYLKLGLGEPKSFGSNLPGSRLAGVGSSTVAVASPTILRASPMFRGIRMSGVITPIQRSPTFKAMDRMFKSPSLPSDKRKQQVVIGAGSPVTPSTQLRKRMVELSLLDKLRSQIRGTTVVSPMPTWTSPTAAKRARVAAPQQQQTQAIRIENPATRETVRQARPAPALTPELGNSREVVVDSASVNQTGPGPSAPATMPNQSLQVTEAAIRLEVTEPAFSAQPSTSTQVLMDKTMAMTSQNSGSTSEKEKDDHIPNPPYLPFCAPPTQSSQESSPGGLFGKTFGAGAGPTTSASAIEGDGLFGGYFAAPPPPTSAGGAPSSKSVDQSSDSFFF